MSYYNITSIIGSQNFGDFAANTSQVLNSYIYGYFVLTVLFCVVFLTLKIKGYSTPPSFAAASWLITLTALFLRPMMLIDNITFWFVILLTPISVLFLFLSGNN